MKNIFCAIYFLLLCANLSSAQIINNVSFDSIKGEYIIKYQLNNEIYTGYYVPANGIKPFVSVSVTANSNSPDYIYNYSWTNLNGAYHPIYSIKLEVESKISDIKSPNKSWTSRYVESISKLIWSKTEGLIPGIAESESQDGFEFKSSDPPAIRNVLTESLTDIYFPEIKDELPLKISLIIDSLRSKTNGIKLKTIAPTKLPENITNTNMLDTLQSYLSFSCDTAWIENQGICNSLQAKLENVRKQLEQDNHRAAGNNLQAFLNQLNALKEKQISSEAYALLYFNGEFLKEKIED